MKTNDIIKFKGNDDRLFRVWKCDPETDTISIGKIGDHESFFETSISKAESLYEKVEE